MVVSETPKLIALPEFLTSSTSERYDFDHVFCHTELCLYSCDDGSCCLRANKMVWAKDVNREGYALFLKSNLMQSSVTF